MGQIQAIQSGITYAVQDNAPVTPKVEEPKYVDITRCLAELNLQATLDACHLQGIYEAHLMEIRSHMPELFEESAQNSRYRAYATLIAAFATAFFTLASIKAPNTFYLKTTCQALGWKGKGSEEIGKALNTYLDGRGQILQGRISISQQDSELWKQHKSELQALLTQLGQLLSEIRSDDRQMASL
jgi:hypothetical protein